MGEFEDRASRLTPREWRVIALILEGVPTAQACESLGIASGTFESHKQAIRRKLGIPRGERLERHLRTFAGQVPLPEKKPERAAAAHLPAAPAEAAERRVRLLFRMTIDELQEIAGSAELRASLLDQTVKRMSPGDTSEADSEVADLRRAAEEIRATARKLLDEVRARTAQEAL